MIQVLLQIPLPHSNNKDNLFTSKKNVFCGINPTQLEYADTGFPCGITFQAGTQQREETLSGTFFCLCANTSTTTVVGYRHVIHGGLSVMPGRQEMLLSALGKCPAQSPPWDPSTCCRLVTLQKHLSELQRLENTGKERKQIQEGRPTPQGRKCQALWTEEKSFRDTAF